MFESNLPDIQKEMKRREKKALTSVGMFVRNKVMENIQRQDIIDTGNLLGKIEYEVKEKSVDIGTNVEYAPYQEYGTIWITKRPFLKPAFTDNLKQIREIIREELGD